MSNLQSLKRDIDADFGKFLQLHNADQIDEQDFDSFDDASLTYRMGFFDIYFVRDRGDVLIGLRSNRTPPQSKWVHLEHLLKYLGLIHRHVADTKKLAILINLNYGALCQFFAVDGFERRWQGYVESARASEEKRFRPK
ncbi:MAG: hypothetical protein JO177_03835 [Candidatus Eremiobacteraeota bacterium]|nr:hypothetical protein [Candidatus Eremiobacteraeota bacterium]